MHKCTGTLLHNKPLAFDADAGECERLTESFVCLAIKPKSHYDFLFAFCFRNWMRWPWNECNEKKNDVFRMPINSINGGMRHSVRPRAAFRAFSGSSHCYLCSLSVRTIEIEKTRRSGKGAKNRILVTKSVSNNFFNLIPWGLATNSIFRYFRIAWISV